MVLYLLVIRHVKLMSTDRSIYQSVIYSFIYSFRLLILSSCLSFRNRFI